MTISLTQVLEDVKWCRLFLFCCDSYLFKSYPSSYSLECCYYCIIVMEIYCRLTILSLYLGLIHCSHILASCYLSLPIHTHALVIDESYPNLQSFSKLISDITMYHPYPDADIDLTMPHLNFLPLASSTSVTTYSTNGEAGNFSSPPRGNIMYACQIGNPLLSKWKSRTVNNYKTIGTRHLTSRENLQKAASWHLANL